MVTIRDFLREYLGTDYPIDQIKVKWNGGRISHSAPMQNFQGSIPLWVDVDGREFYKLLFKELVSELVINEKIGSYLCKWIDKLYLKRKFPLCRK
jgi:hypothetical protein